VIRALVSLPPDDDAYHISYPLAQYDHDEGNAICGGFEYLGKEVPQLAGRYVFGDIVNGRLFFVEMKDIKPGSRAPIHEFQVSLDGETKSFQQVTGNTRVNLRIGRDAEGKLYLFNKQNGKVDMIINT